MILRQTIYRGSDNPVTLARLFDDVDDTYQEGATVICDLFDANGAAISGAANIPMAQVAGTTGINVLYRGEIADTLTLPAGNGSAVIKATNLAGKVRRFVIPVKFED